MLIELVRKECVIVRMFMPLLLWMACDGTSVASFGLLFQYFQAYRVYLVVLIDCGKISHSCSKVCL